MLKLIVVAVAVAASLTPAVALAQNASIEAEIRAAVPYSAMLAKLPGLTLQQYNDAVRDLAKDKAQERALQVPLSQRAYVPPAAPLYQPRPSPRQTYEPPAFTVPAYQPPVYQAPSYTVPPYQPPPVPAARTGSTYDWQSGNLYNWSRDSRGNTTVNGTNLNTGSLWQTEIKPNGSMTGYDKNFNYWNYDARTKSYINLGTGVMCVGEGYARVCTGGR